MAYVNDPLSVPKVLHNSFQPFAQDLGILVSPAFFQIGSNVIKNNMPYLGWCARAFSLVKKDICFEEPALLSYHTPLWHSSLFLNDQRLSYFSPRLIRLGVLTVGQLLEDDSLFSQLAPTWEPIYRRRLTTSHPPPPPVPTPHTSLPYLLVSLDPLAIGRHALTTPLAHTPSARRGVAGLSSMQPSAFTQRFHPQGPMGPAAGGSAPTGLEALGGVVSY